MTCLSISIAVVWHIYFSWVHTLNGSALIQTELGGQEITEDYFLLLPPGLKVKIISLNDVTLFRLFFAEAELWLCISRSDMHVNILT